MPDALRSGVAVAAATGCSSLGANGTRFNLATARTQSDSRIAISGHLWKNSGSFRRSAPRSKANSPKSLAVRQYHHPKSLRFESRGSVVARTTTQAYFASHFSRTEPLREDLLRFLRDRRDQRSRGTYLSTIALLGSVDCCSTGSRRADTAAVMWDHRGCGRPLRARHYLRHQRERTAFRVLEERHPFFRAVGMLVDHVGRAHELDAA